MYACHPLPLATRRHFTDKISSKRKQNNPPSRKNQKTSTYRQSLFLPRILQLRKKRRIRPLEILKKDRKKKKRSITTKTPQTRTPQKEETGEPVTPPQTKNQAEKNYCSKLSQNIMKQKGEKSD